MEETLLEQQQASPTSVATTSTGNATPACSYDDLFPALPVTPVGSTITPSCVRVTSSQKTQVK